MAFLRRHLMKFYPWHQTGFFRIGEFQNIIMMLHIYEQNERDELFFDVLTDTTNNYRIKSPVIDYFVLIGTSDNYMSAFVSATTY